MRSWADHLVSGRRTFSYAAQQVRANQLLEYPLSFPLVDSQFRHQLWAGYRIPGGNELPSRPVIRIQRL